MNCKELDLKSHKEKKIKYILSLCDVSRLKMLMRFVLQKHCCDPVGDGPKQISWNASSQENTGGAFKCTWVFLADLTSLWKFLKSFQ